MKFKPDKHSKEGFENFFEEPIKINNTTSLSPDALTSGEITENVKIKFTQNSATGALEALKERLSKLTLVDAEKNVEVITQKDEMKKNSPTASPVVTPQKKNETLLDKCMPYILDDCNEDILNPEPLYKLQSVAEILKSDSEKILEKLAKNYDVSFETESLSDKESVASINKPENESIPPIVQKEEPISQKKVISDIDYTDIPEVPKSTPVYSNATVTFTPVSNNDSITTDLKVTTQTINLDLTSELIKPPENFIDTTEDELKLEQSEFEDYIPKTEYSSFNDIKKLKRKFMISKRNTFLVTVSTFFITIILCLAKLPFINEIMLSETRLSMIVCGCITLIAVLLNLNMFISTFKLFSKKSSPDTLSALATLLTMAYTVLGILKGETVLDVLIVLAITLCFRSLRNFHKASYMLGNFQQISNESEKKAVKLINDQTIAFSMAKNAIEGDVLIAAAQKTEHISDYMKYSTYEIFLGGRFPIIIILSVILSLISGIAGTVYFDGVYYGIYSAVATILLITLPSLFLIDTLPIYRASKKLNRLGAMITGKVGAEHLEMANAVVLSSNDLFPAGTVTLHQMKILSENSLDDTLVRAAALTEYMSSTLAPIFKEIANTGNYKILPDTDTVKYEDRMGISGWVDNRLLFIGNRTLMEAHSISVPSLEVDRKILRQGFFPIYVAAGNKACALLIVKYSVERKIAAELRALTRIGITLLINNTDPNLSEPMICDYLGLYEDSVKVMSPAGCHMYKNAVTKTASTSAPAAYKGSSLALAAIINCATRIKRSNIILTAVYVISAVLGTLVFAYASFSGSGTLLSSNTLLIYTLISTIVSYLIYSLEKP